MFIKPRERPTTATSASRQVNSLCPIRTTHSTSSYPQPEDAYPVAIGSELGHFGRGRDTSQPQGRGAAAPYSRQKTKGSIRKSLPICSGHDSKAQDLSVSRFVMFVFQPLFPGLTLQSPSPPPPGRVFISLYLNRLGIQLSSGHRIRINPKTCTYVALHVIGPQVLMSEMEGADGCLGKYTQGLGQVGKCATSLTTIRPSVCVCACVCA